MNGGFTPTLLDVVVVDSEEEIMLLFLTKESRIKTSSTNVERCIIVVLPLTFKPRTT
jgi:hypothetical protein